MDIIFQGTIPEEKKYVATCSNCSTKVQYKLKEVKVTHCQREGTSHEYNCPVCSKKVYTNPCPVVDSNNSKLQPDQFDSLYYTDR